MHNEKHKKEESTIGVLLMAYGSPHRPEDVREFYTDIRKGKAPSDELITEIESRYREIGGATPFNRITEAQAEAVQALLDHNAPGKYRVYLGMKHWRPTIQTAVEAMKGDGISNVITLVLAPHYSSISIGEYREKVEHAMDHLDYHPELRCIDNWHDNEHFIACVTNQIGDTPHLVIFTSHSIPERIVLAGDPYREQLLETCALIAKRFGPGFKWQFAFQSAGRTPESWLGPDVQTVLTKLAEEGCKEVVVCPIGFTADNLEIVYDIDILLVKLGKTLGITVHRTPSRNTHPEFIEAVVSEIVED